MATPKRGEEPRTGALFLVLAFGLGFLILKGGEAARDAAQKKP